VLAGVVGGDLGGKGFEFLLVFEVELVLDLKFVVSLLVKFEEVVGHKLCFEGFAFLTVAGDVVLFGYFVHWVERSYESVEFGVEICLICEDFLSGFRG